MAIQIRDFAEKDLPALVDLSNEFYEHSYEFHPYDEERLRSRIQEGRLRILMAEVRGTIVGSTAYHDGHWGEEIEWLIVQGPNRRHVENTLVEEAERYVKKGTVFTTVDAGSPKISEWAERGYEAEGELYHMVASLDTMRLEPRVPEDIVICGLGIGGEEKLVEAVNAGFGWERIKVGDIEKWKLESSPFNEDWIHVAEAENRIVSTVVSKPDTYYNRFFNGNRGYLGPAATLPAYRGKSLASALTIRAMNFLLQKGMTSVALYTVEQNVPSVTLLKKLGFQIGHSWKFLRRHLPAQGQLECS